MSVQSTAATLRRNAKILAAISVLTAAISVYLLIQGFIDGQPRVIALAVAAVVCGAASLLCFMTMEQARMEEAPQRADHDEEPSA